MKCSDLQLNLSLYADGGAGVADSAAIKDHLAICPVCRQRYADYREIASELKQLRRPQMSAALRNSLKDSARSQIRIEKQSVLPVSNDLWRWLQLTVMPYGVGVMASVTIGVTFLTMMFSGMLKPVGDRSYLKGDDSTIILAKSSSPVKSDKTDDISFMLASNSNPFRPATDIDEISPLDFAQTRYAFAAESPSINPQGALIALTKSLVRGGMKDDEVVVVADVFGNGLARISEVVEPSRDLNAVSELERALESDSSYSPFVPSSMETRPESVRVVLRIQQVDVNTGLKPNRRR